MLFVYTLLVEQISELAKPLASLGPSPQFHVQPAGVEAPLPRIPLLIDPRHPVIAGASLRVPSPHCSPVLTVVVRLGPDVFHFSRVDRFDQSIEITRSHHIGE